MKTYINAFKELADQNDGVVNLPKEDIKNNIAKVKKDIAEYKLSKK